MQLGGSGPETRAFAWADAEYRRRNGGTPIPAYRTSGPPYWSIGRLDSQVGEIDAFTYEEASALLNEAMKAAHLPKPPPGLFVLVPSARNRRDKAASVPWWKRIFDDSAAGPPPVTVPIADIYPRAVPIWRDPARDTAPVYEKPIQTLADLVALQPTSLPAQTVSGGGAYGEIRNQMLHLGNEYAIALRSGFQPQVALNIAIQARNGVIRDGGSKVLIGAWNEEIRQLLWLTRRMP
ncbi:hypothetical protein [Streptomyces sp. NPDC001568]|uniref:hypothetical protein n=1 Tax=Streptomyces sp. NPDC001568 TaxID=3364588 RepID=UPI0036781AA3